MRLLAKILATENLTAYININKFKQYIISSSLNNDNNSEDPNALFTQYNQILGDIIYRHAPIKTKTVFEHQHCFDNNDIKKIVNLTTTSKACPF
jgi:hypothetical protein